MYVRDVRTGPPTAIALAIASIVGGAGCSDSLPPKPQLLVVVDTDLPLVEGVGGGGGGAGDVSADAAVDTLRIDLVSAEGATQDGGLLTLLLPDASGWPASFGLDTSTYSGGPIRLRLRAFRSDRSTEGDEAGEATLDPQPSVTIDRVVDLTPSTAGVQTVEVTLSGYCIGVGASFTTDTTCVGQGTLAGAFTDGIADLASADDATSVVGTWTPAFATTCSAPPPDAALAPDTVCIPGGYTVMGDLAFDGVATLVYDDSTPLLPALVAPFYLDWTEFTVGRLRTLVNDGTYTAPLPDSLANPGSLGAGAANCTWVDDLRDSARDTLPVTCVAQETAAAICAAVHGRLPTEAEWEHEARGRGQGLLFPWGNVAPMDCGQVAASRVGMASTCVTGSALPDAVGTHPDDVSRDLIVDLGGNVGEVTSDIAAPSFSSPCWGGGTLGPIARTCASATSTSGAMMAVTAQTRRGGAIDTTLDETAAPYRAEFTLSANNGFRCAYDGVTP
jgi:formylglycine-generating enzyme required for sulfatase activity